MLLLDYRVINRNTRVDTPFYITFNYYNLPVLTTGDILVDAFQNEIITEEQGNLRKRAILLGTNVF